MSTTKRKPTAPYCRRCRSTKLTVTRTQQRLRGGGKRRDVASVTCANGHEWWSRAALVVARSRELDRLGQSTGPLA